MVLLISEIFIVLENPTNVKWRVDMSIQESILVPIDNNHCYEILKTIRMIGKDYFDYIGTEIKYIIISEEERVVHLKIFDPFGTFTFRKGKKYIIIRGENYIEHKGNVSMTEMLFKDRLSRERTPGILSTGFFPEGEFKVLEGGMIKFFTLEKFTW